MGRSEPEVGAVANERIAAPATPLERSVLWMLRGDRYTIGELCSQLRKSRREVEEAVEFLRLRGEPIVAGNDGLHLTEDPDELTAYVEARRRRMASIYLGSRALRRTLRYMRERADLTLWDVA